MGRISLPVHVNDRDLYFDLAERKRIQIIPRSERHNCSAGTWFSDGEIVCLDHQGKASRSSPTCTQSQKFEE
jgi:hypothetical protein